MDPPEPRLGEPFAVETTDRRGARIVAVRGELDMTTVVRVETAAGRPAPGSGLVVDLRRVAFMDSAGVHLLMRLSRRSRDERWSLTVVRGPGAVTRLIEMCHLEDRIAVVDDLPEPA